MATLKPDPSDEDVARFHELVRDGAQSPVAGALDRHYFDGLRDRLRTAADRKLRLTTD